MRAVAVSPKHPRPFAERARSLVVSIHDVAPATQVAAAKMLEELAEIGVHSCSLLVVPNYHHRGDSLEDESFRAWLQAAVAQGHEVVIHGYFHERARQPNESFIAQVTTRFYTAGEGEFYDLSYDDAFRCITDAREQFEQHGFHATGFIAPAWLLGAEAQRALTDAGLSYTTRLGSVVGLRSGHEFRSQSLVWSVRSAWRRVISRAWNPFLSRRLTSNPLLRIGIHPPDLQHPKIWRQILNLTATALTDREPTTYRDWIDAAESRSQNPTPCLP